MFGRSYSEGYDEGHKDGYQAGYVAGRLAVQNETGMATPIRKIQTLHGETLGHVEERKPDDRDSEPPPLAA